MRILSRPYAPTVAGVPKESHYDDKAGAYTLRFLPTDAGDRRTIIFKHRHYHFPAGFQVSITPPNSATWAVVSDNVLQVSHHANATAEIEVVISQA